jgi:hypothetical protein
MGIAVGTVIKADSIAAILRLTGRPCERSSTHQVQVGVEDALSSTSPRIKDGSVGGKTFGDRQSSGNGKELPYECGVGFGQFINIRVMLSRNDQDMSRRLWVEIAEGKDVLILKEKLCTKFIRCNLAEDTHDETL